MYAAKFNYFCLTLTRNQKQKTNDRLSKGLNLANMFD